jgi:hypothetical protein
MTPDENNQQEAAVQQQTQTATTPKPRGLRGAIQAYKAKQQAARQQELTDIERENPDINQILDDMSTTDIFKLMNPQKTPQQIQREQRRAKAEEDWAAIQDALNALSEMTTSPTHTYTPRTTLSDQARARRERLETQRKAERNAYFENYLKARQSDQTLAQQLKQQAFQNELAKSKDVREKAAHESQMQVNQSTVAKNNASAAASLRKGADNEGKKKYYGSLTVGDEVFSYKTRDDYNTAVYEYAKQYNVPTQVKVYTSTGTVMKNRVISAIAADVQAAASAAKKSDPTQTTSNGKKADPTKK